MVHTTVRVGLSEENWRRLRLAAELEHRSLSNFVAHAVLAYLNEKGTANDGRSV